MFDAVAGRALCERTIALARDLHDRAAESKALWNLMTLNVFSGGDPAEAVDAGEASLAIARELDAREQMAFTLNDLWRPYAAVADLAAARACLEESRPLWRELENLPMYCENLSSTAALLALEGKNEESLKLCDESYRISEEIGNHWGQSYCLLNAYHIDLSQGNIGRAFDKMHACIEHAELAGFVIPQAISRAQMGAAYASLGAIDRGVRLADEGLAIALDHNAMAIPIVKAAQAEIFLLAGRLDDAEAANAESVLTRLPGLLFFSAAANVEILDGRIAALRGDHAKAVEIADRMIEWLRPLGVRPYNPAAFLLKGSSLVELGELEEAERALLEGSAEAEALGFDPIQWKIEMALSRVASATGDEARAADLRNQAKDIVDRIAGTIDDAQLRSSFLTRPEVRAVAVS